MYFSIILVKFNIEFTYICQYILPIISYDLRYICQCILSIISLGCMHYIIIKYAHCKQVRCDKNCDCIVIEM